MRLSKRTDTCRDLVANATLSRGINATASAASMSGRDGVASLDEVVASDTAAYADFAAHANRKAGLKY